MSDVAQQLRLARTHPDTFAAGIDGRPTYSVVVEPREHGGFVSDFGTSDVVLLPIPIVSGHASPSVTPVRDGRVLPWLDHRPTPQRREHLARDAVADALTHAGHRALCALTDLAGMKRPTINTIPLIDTNGTIVGVRLEPAGIFAIELKRAGAHPDRLPQQLKSHLDHIRRLTGKGWPGPAAVIALTGDPDPPTTITDLLRNEPQIAHVSITEFVSRMRELDLPRGLDGRLEKAAERLGTQPRPKPASTPHLPDGLTGVDRLVDGYLLPDHAGSPRKIPRYLASVEDVEMLLSWHAARPVRDMLHERPSLTDHVIGGTGNPTRLFAIEDVLAWADEADIRPPSLAPTRDQVTLEGVRCPDTGKAEWFVTCRVATARGTRVGIPCPPHEPFPAQRWRHDGPTHARLVMAGPLWRLIADAR